MNVKRQLLVCVAYLPYVSLLLTSFVLSSMRRVPLLSDVRFWQADKVFHFFGFMALAFFASIATTVHQKSWSSKSQRKAFYLSFFYAVFDELHQIFVPMRSCSFWDLMADAVGILIGLKLFSMLVQRIKN